MNRRKDISFEEYSTLENGWSHYRSFGSADAARWYFERLPDEPGRFFAIVNHPTRHIIAERESFAHRV